MFSLALKPTHGPSRFSPADALARGLGVRRPVSDVAGDSLVEFSVRASYGLWRPSRHLELLAAALEELEAAILAGAGFNLAVFMPPRHGKTELAAINFPARFLCRNPDRRIILGTYGAELAHSHSRHAREIVEEQGPRLYDVRVDPRSGAVDHWEIAAARGGMIAAGAGGPFTGHGGDLGIIDDPYKNRQEAESAAHRAKLQEWYQSAFVTRLEPGAGQVLSMTRWHPDDLGGWVLTGAVGAWRVLDLCAIPETKEDAKRDPLKRKIGETLWPERWTPAQMQAKRVTVGAYNWASMYQQRPRRSDGSLFKRAWFGVFHDRGDHYELTPPVGQGPTRRIPKDQCTTFQIVDPAASLKTQADYFVDGTFVQTPTNDLLVRDIVRTHVEGPDQVGLLRTGRAKWGAAWIGVEQVAFQLTLFQAARRAGLPVRAIAADKDKFSRALSASARYEAGTVFHPAEAPWLAEYEQELVDFPNGAHDDQVDVVSYAAASLLASQPIDLELPVLRRGQ